MRSALADAVGRELGPGRDAAKGYDSAVVASMEASRPRRDGARGMAAQKSESQPPLRSPWDTRLDDAGA